MKQTRLWLTTIAVLLCSLTASAHDFVVGGIYYDIKSTTDLTVAVTYVGSSYDYYSNEYSGAVTIPETVTYNNNTYSVTSIGYAAFRDCRSLTSITLPESVTSIGSYAFYNCSSLTSITLPESVTSIGEGAFSVCSSLYKVINCSTLSLSKGTSNYGNVAYYAKVVYRGSELTTVGDYQFYTSNGIYSLVNYIGKDTEIVLPDSYNGENYKIGDCAFRDCSSLTSITLPESVTSIGDYAFSVCSSLTSITIPEGVTSIGDYAFDNCTALKKVVIEDGCSTLSLGYNHYSNSSSSSTGQGLFYDCPLGELYLGRNLSYSSGSSYGYSPFYKSNRFPTISLGNNVTSIPSYLFYNNTSLTSITLPEGVTSIGDYAFSGCSSLAAITLPEGVTSIGISAFSVCSSLTSITIPESVISIGNSAFNGCTSLEEVVIEDGSTTLSLGYDYYSRYGDGEGLFNDCPVEKVYLGRNLSYNNDSHYGRSPFFSKDELTNVVVGNEVTEIGQYAFENCDNLHSLTIGSGVLSIGSYAFSYPDKIIWLTNTPPTDYNKVYGRINYVANDQYTNLSNTKVYPYLSSMFEVDGVKYVPVSPAERTCDAIDCAYDSTAATINVSETTSFKGVAMTVKEVMPYAFYENNHIKEVNIAHKGNIGDYAFYNCDSILSVELSNEGNIGIKAFYDNDGIQEIIVPNSVKSLGQYCFYDCDSLKSVVLGDGVSAISDYAFSACSSLNDVEIGSSVAAINNYAFQNCSSLPTITIPQAVTTIGDNVFAGCSNLSDVIITDRTEPLALGSNDSSPLFADCPLDSVYIGGKITYSTTSSKGYSPFYRNTSLRSVVITDREEQICDNEFYGCTNLQNVTIGNGVKSIGDYAFSGCSSLAGFSFGSSMESIGTEAFSDCTSLTSITSHAAVPPTCGTQALDDINKWECVLGVPLGNADAYYAADQWKEFFFIDDVVEVDHYVLTYVVDGEVVHTEVLKHKDAVTMLAEPTKVGYEFSGWDKTLATMPAEDVIISGTFTRLPVDNLVILDTEEYFLIDEEMECDTVTYTRHFNDTQWQALYVSFEIPYDSLKNYFEVADLNNVHQYDRDNDGVTDETVIEAFKLTSGTLEANYPYLIRAKEAGEKSITVTDAALYDTEENSIDCSSVRDKFTFTGTYSSLSSAELPQGEGYYTLIEGEWKPVTETVALGAFRFFLKVDSRSGAAAEARSIRMRIIGENGEDDTTGIDNLESTGNDGKTTVIYDLQGRKVLNTETLQEGVYIINGKKVVIK